MAVQVYLSAGDLRQGPPPDLAQALLLSMGLSGISFQGCLEATEHSQQMPGLRSAQATVQSGPRAPRSGPPAQVPRQADSKPLALDSRAGSNRSTVHEDEDRQ